MKTKFTTVGQLVDQRRDQVGMTQAQLAEQLGYSTPQFISNWERGRASVPPKMFRKISQLLGIPMRELIDHECREHRRALVALVRLS